MFFFFFKQKTAYEIMPSLVGSEMCIRDRLGVMGMPFPAEYGGAGADYIAYIIAIEELSKVCGSHGVIVQTHNALCCWPIFTYGTEEQKRKYLPDLLSGKKLGAFGLTEPNAGTDAAMQQTKAVDMGDHWVINGTKIFISGGGIAEVYVVMAMTDKSKGTKGISAFIICLLYTSDAADEEDSVDLGGRRIIKKK